MSSQPMASAVNYPYPFEINVANYVPLKLNKKNYSVWKQLMLNLIDSHELEGFVEGTIQPPPFPLEEHKQEEYRSWKRSDGLVRAWIFATVTENILLKKVSLKTAGEHEEVLSTPHESEEILPELVSLKTAREVWIALENILAPSESKSKAELEDNARRYLPLYRAARNGDWENAAKFLEEEPNGVRDAITSEETALMLAVRTSKRNHFLKKLLDKMSPEDVARRDNFGQTALYKAMKSSNNVAAKLMVDKNPELPNIVTAEPSELAVHYAARQGNREMVNYLLEVTNPNLFEGQLGAKLLTDLVYGELYDIASTFLERYPKLASMRPTPLIEISYHLTSFRSGICLNFFQHLIYSGIPLKLEENANKPVGRDVENSAESIVSPLCYCIPQKLEGNANKPVGRDVENSAEGIVSPLCYLSQKMQAMFWDVAEKLVPTIKSVRETKLKHHKTLMFVKHLCEEVLKSGSSKADSIFWDSLAEAAALGISEIVEEIVEVFPSALYLNNGKGQSLFQIAIENRRENVFNLIYQLDENQDFFLTMSDNSENNALHTAGKFAAKQQISLQANVAGAALQIQRELQWFKAVEKLLNPVNKTVRNNNNKTPEDVFTETHKDLVEKGEKWMKDTANSCSIVAVLIITVVFAAAITVPGGINSNSGLPIFLENRVFVLFGVFDALALFSSTTSLLMFLSIFTSRYGEQDFLYSLPRKLIIGMATLFLSIISMMIAFGATLKIVFGYKSVWVVIPLVVLSSVPITLFGLLQFPLLLDMIRSTYFPSIFGKRSNRILF